MVGDIFGVTQNVKLSVYYIPNCWLERQSHLRHILGMLVFISSTLGLGQVLC